MGLILIVSLKKVLVRSNRHFALKMARHHNSGLTLTIFLKFCILEGTNKYMKISLMVFLKKKMSFWANGPFWARKWFDFVTLDPLSGFFFNLAQ